MQQFAALFTRLDQTNKTNAKVAALADYFREAPGPDRLWTIALLSRRRPRRTINTTLLRQWAAERSGLPLWLFEESYHVVGDLAETIALTLPPGQATHEKGLSAWINRIRSWGKLEEEQKKEAVWEAWDQLDTPERFVFNKLITGGFRMGVSQKLMTRALSQATGIEEKSLAHRLMGNWRPDDTTFDELILSEDPLEDISRPYPFFLAHPLEGEPKTLGEAADWLVERKWDGIRGQLIAREGEVFVWSRGEELLTDRFPEFQHLGNALPDGTVIDGEILPFKDGRPLPFQHLQTRIGRKKVTKKVLAKAPVILKAYDLLEYRGEDIRERPLLERRGLLEKVLTTHENDNVLQLSELLELQNWEAYASEREDSRTHYSEGLMLKHRKSPYLSGRKRGYWWKWKVDPLIIDGVMIYAQRGHGRRANLYTDFTFAVWDGDQLVPFTKAYSGLTDEEFRQITHWVQRNTRERFGPVRSVEPVQVFELAFEGIQASKRHKSGVALRFPRIKRWRKDKSAAEANTLADLQAMLKLYGA